MHFFIPTQRRPPSLAGEGIGRYILLIKQDRDITNNENLNIMAYSENLRKLANLELDETKRTELGQYMTPASVASFMASLFPKWKKQRISLLDPGAGIGSLSTAFINEFCVTHNNPKIDLTTYEIDPVMLNYLQKNLSEFQESNYSKNCTLTWKIIKEDFVIKASTLISSANSLWEEKLDLFTHCIMNPPYKKISSSSRHRKSLRLVGIETVNLYSAFIALAILLLEKNGYLVAIVPRSFCNGPYYRSFREFILKNTAIRRIHLFESRNKAFKEDKVLQENIIIALEKNAKQNDVTISTSTDDSFSDIVINSYPFSDIVKDSDRELFIHIPIATDNFIDLSKVFANSLYEIGINVSTGPVVDFRVKEYLKQNPEKGTVPLLHPCHFKKDTFIWPIENGKKPNAIISNSDTQKWLYPNGYYTVVRRFSSKEEKRRIRASVVYPSLLNGAKYIGLENHLNVFHENKKPLDAKLAKGLSVYLNSTAVDEYFRRFSGHTQVNATDLKSITYPSKVSLLKLGKWAESQNELTQEKIDQIMETISR